MRQMNRLTLWVCLCCLFTVPGVSHAEFVDYRPDDIRIDGDLVAVVFEQTDGTLYCAGGTLGDVGQTLLPHWPIDPNKAEQIGPTLVANAKPLPEYIKPLCWDMGWGTPPGWTVAQFSDNPDRPVKRILPDGTIDKDDTIGRIAHGEPCGEYIEDSRWGNTWRNVTITYQDGTQVQGAAVCEQN